MLFLDINYQLTVTRGKIGPGSLHIVVAKEGQNIGKPILVLVLQNTVDSVNNIFIELHMYLSRSSITEVELVDSLRKEHPDVLVQLVNEAADHDRRVFQAVTDDTHYQPFNFISSVVVQHCWEQRALVLKRQCLEVRNTKKYQL